MEEKETFNSFMEAFYTCLRERYDPDNKEECIKMADFFISLLKELMEIKKHEEKFQLGAKTTLFKMEQAKQMIINDELPRGVCCGSPDMEAHVEEMVEKLKRVAA